MTNNIIIYMVVRNISERYDILQQVFAQAAKISRFFYVVDHGSSDNTQELLAQLKDTYQLELQVASEPFEGTMDEMKGKHYQILKQNYGNSSEQKTYLFILDWDEVPSNGLVSAVNQLDGSADIYMVSRGTYLMQHIIDDCARLPLLFEANSVEVGAFQTFHDLYRCKSKNIQKVAGILHHYSYTSMSHMASKTEYYAKKEAEALYEANPNISNVALFFKMIFEQIAYFTYTLIFRKNFLHFEGWLYSISWIVYKYLFYLELKNKNAL